MIVKDSKDHRSALGKLLAREDITINHGNYKTAFFDVKNRVLGLPDWSDKSKSVYDMLLGHEVGHALYTPLEELEHVKGMQHFDVINIVEDVRIERMIQKTYPGLPRYFKEGYTELWANGFFGVDEDEVANLNFLDRLNLHAKVGKIVDVPLSDEELELYNECYAAETFDDVMKIYQKIVDRLEEEKEEKEGKQEEFKHDEPNVPDNNEDETPPMGGGNDDITDEDFAKALEELENESKDLSGHDDDFQDDGTEAEEDDSENVSSAGNEAPEEPVSSFESSTQRKFDESLEKEQVDKFASNPHGAVPAMFPTKKSLKKVLVNYKDLDEERKVALASREKTFEEVFEDGVRHYDYNLNEYYEYVPSEQYLKFKKETSKKVATLVREFERKKSAYQYSRAQVSRSGKLDVNRIHSYKYDDNIFASVTNLADAKSHGMIFFIDYSGSMHGTIGGVMKQTLLLTEFCDKVGIPYEVYSFTDCGYWGNESDFGFKDEISLHGVRITNPLSSKMKKKEKIYYRKFLWLIADRFDHHEDPWFRGESEHFGGTPLNSTLLASIHLIDKFRAENPIQKLMLITLSDGDSHPAGLCGDRHVYHDLSLKHRNKKVIITKSGRRQTEDIVKAIGQLKDVTMIGFYIPNNSSDVNHQLYSRGRFEERKELMKKYKKEKHLEIKDFRGYDSYFFMDSNTQVTVEEEEFNPNITDKAGKSMAESASSQKKLAKEFAKNKSSSRNTRILLEKFAEMVA